MSSRSRRGQDAYTRNGDLIITGLVRSIKHARRHGHGSAVQKAVPAAGHQRCSSSVRVALNPSRRDGQVRSVRSGRICYKRMTCQAIQGGVGRVRQVSTT
jgi:hypothetical protein